jgi:lipid-A-disaccharide synthase
MSRIAVVAGEASGDMHAASLVCALRRLQPDLECFGMGGDRMHQEGVELLYHVNELAVMGFSELVGKLPFFRRVMRTVRKELLRRRPALLVLVDYPGFNLRLASWARRHGFRVFYYIAPQVWAWGRRRLRTMRASIDRLAVILPFEQEFFSAAGIDVRYVGHPLLDVSHAPVRRQTLSSLVGVAPADAVLGIFPGSRACEVERLLPVMAESWAILASRVPSLRPVVAAASSAGRELAEQRWPLPERPAFVSGCAYEVLIRSRLALVASGTVTLEAACAGTPMVVLYKVSRLSAALVSRMIRIPDVALVNVVAGRRIVPELLQSAAVPSAIADAAAPLLEDGTERRDMVAELSGVRDLLGQPGASARAASLAAEMIP